MLHPAAGRVGTLHSFAENEMDGTVRARESYIGTIHYPNVDPDYPINVDPIIVFIIHMNGIMGARE